MVYGVTYSSENKADIPFAYKTKIPYLFGDFSLQLSETDSVGLEYETLIFTNRMRLGRALCLAESIKNVHSRINTILQELVFRSHPSIAQFLST